MADKTDPQTDPQQTQTNDGGDDKEASFWKRLTDTLDERIDKGVERALEKHGSVGKSRNPNDKRRTVPNMLADFMFGPEKKD
jgi:hypothetical protein